MLSRLVVSPDWLNEEFRPSGCLWSSRLLVLSPFVRNLFVRFSSLGLRLKALSPCQVLPLKEFAVLGVLFVVIPLVIVKY